MTLAHQHELTHHEFLKTLLVDEATRRDTQSAILRGKTAGLDASMTLDHHWDDTTKIAYDRAVWNELYSLRSVDAPNDVVILGPVGVGRTFLATTLGHIAVRRGRSVHFERADATLKRLKATRLDNSHDAEVPELLRVDVLILDLYRVRSMPSGWAGAVVELAVVGIRSTSGSARARPRLEHRRESARSPARVSGIRCGPRSPGALPEPGCRQT